MGAGSPDPWATAHARFVQGSRGPKGAAAVPVSMRRHWRPDLASRSHPRRFAPSGVTVFHDPSGFAAESPRTPRVPRYPVFAEVRMPDGNGRVSAVSTRFSTKFPTAPNLVDKS